ncbi:MAG: hypothetical protein M1297_00140, partial [Nitrospirae bacterium]|nr:hypothetical protein [Nitrospirota bacterium]
STRIFCTALIDEKAIGCSFAPLREESGGPLCATGYSPSSLQDFLVSGLYPPIYGRNADAGTWYGNPVRTSPERMSDRFSRCGTCRRSGDSCSCAPAVQHS